MSFVSRTPARTVLRRNFSISAPPQTTSSPTIRRKAYARTDKPKNELAARLWNINFAGKKSTLKGPSGDRNRINIVSEELCNDVLQRLAPSSRRHLNCDIIDVNPGVGLFSRKLHDLVKPRSHILMEPDEELYRPYLEPLVADSRSTYRLIPESGVVWSNLLKIQTEGFLSKQKPLSVGDPKFEEPNDTLLFVANLGYHPQRPFHGFASITTLMMHQLTAAIRTHSLFQCYGLVRMLIWMSDKDKWHLLPRNVTQRTKSAIEAEATCQDIFEVAGAYDSTPIRRHGTRDYGIELESAKIVRERAEQSGIQDPHDRKTPQLQDLKSGEEMLFKTSVTKRPFMDTLTDLEERFAKNDFPAYHDAKGKPFYKTDLVTRGHGHRLKLPAKARKTEEFVQLSAARNRLRAIHTQDDIVETLIADYEDILRRLTKAVDIDERVLILEQLADMKADIESRGTKINDKVWQRIDNRRIFKQQPSVLLWDRRKAEPLAVEMDEFFPAQEMCLLDFHPKSSWPVFRGSNSSDYDYFEFMLTSFFINPSQSIVKALTALAPGAAEWLIPRCPSLTDVENGGSQDLENLSVRSLNQTMYRELIEAFLKWPFRLSKSEMLGRLGSQNIDEADGGDSGLLDSV